MKIALLQCNAVTGDVVGNVERIAAAAREAAAAGVDLCVTPELALVGPEPGSYAQMVDFADGCGRGLDLLAEAVRDAPPLLVGAPGRSVYAQGLLSNAAVLIGKADDVIFEACRPTGYAELDRCLGGGLTAGLHCLGAVPSLGKSTYVMQMAEQMAAEGTHVIVISLEMKPVDLAAKAVSRQLYMDWHETSAGLLKTSGELRSRTAVIKLTGREWMAVEEAAGKVEKRSRTITVEECGAKAWTAEDIAQYVEKYISAFGVIPVVIVDYLQILAAPEGKGSLTDKQAVDESLRVLKSLSDSRKLPVVLISSLNRESYDQPVSLRSYKDTGSIEYSCDTVLGMQYRGVGARDFDVFQAQGQNPRELEVCVLKQRYGAVGIRIPYRFYPAYSCFEELPSARSGKQPKGSKRQAQDDGILEV